MSETDLQLLTRYTQYRAEDAFAEVVRRHVDLVYSAALRQVCSPQLAEEVAQSAFTDLARNVSRLAPDTIVTAWLYEVTRRTAIDVVRRETRRQLREQIATELNTMNATASDWTQIEPLLDEAVHALDQTDRAAVLLRYFENKSLREVGEQLGVSDDAAQKRVSRALEKLRENLSRRGVTTTAAVLTVLVSANAVHAAPISLALNISTSALAAGTTASFATKVIIMTSLQKTLIVSTLIVAVGAGIYEARQISDLKNQLSRVQQQQMPLSEQVLQLTRERDEAQGQLVILRDDNERLKRSTIDLPKLRGTAARLQQNQQELAQLKARARSNSPFSDAISRMTEDPEWKEDMRKTSEKVLKGEYAQLFKTWKLSPEQQTKMIELLTENQTRNVARTMSLLQGGSRAELQNQITADREKMEQSIGELLGEDRLKEFKQFENTLADRSVLDQFKGELGKNKLPSETADQLLAVMLEERAKYPALANRADAAHSLKQLDSAAAQQFFQDQEQMNRAVLGRSAAFLTVEQLAALTRVQTNGLASMQKSFRLQQRLFGDAN